MIKRVIKFARSFAPSSQSKILLSVLYVMVATVGVRNTFLIVYRAVKEIKALNLQHVKKVKR